MIRRPPRSTLFPSRRSSDLVVELIAADGTVGLGEAAPTARYKESVKTVEAASRSEEHTSELQSHLNLVCRLLLEKKILQLTKTGSVVRNLQLVQLVLELVAC